MSWAHICKHGETIALPEDLTPCLDSTVIDVPAGLEAKILEVLPYLSEDKDHVRSLKLPLTKEIDADVFRATLEMTAENVNVQKLKDRAKTESTLSHHDVHLSTFVVVNAYLWNCLIKVRGGEEDRPVAFSYGATLRNRLRPSVPETYLGNCMCPIGCFGYNVKPFLGGGGFMKAVEILSDSVKVLGSQGVDVLFDLFVDRMKNKESGIQQFGVSGSNRFCVNRSDFGWGRPVNSEIVSTDRSQNWSMSKRRDATGGVQIGLCLKNGEMDAFISLYEHGLED